MKKWKPLAIVFTLLTVGAIQESLRIFRSSAPDIAANRDELKVFAIVLTALFFFLAMHCWRKAANSRRL